MKKREVLIVSRFHEAQKNLKAALRIWKRIEDSGRAAGWKLKLVGHGDDEKMIIDYAAGLGLKRMELVGRADNPLPLYKDASVFMMTSRNEGFGVTLTEALQNGTVVVAFDSFGAVRDIVEDGMKGFLIKPFDEEAFAEKLLGIMADNDLRARMAVAAVNSSKKFSVNNIGAEWENLFSKI